MKIKNSVDIIKVVCCILIIGSHCLPIFNISVLDFYYGQWFFRFCVPLFFISTGYFFELMEPEKKRKYIFRIISIYFISTLLYLPLSKDCSFFGLIWNVIYGYHHLWYLSALAIGLIIVLFADMFLKRYKYVLLIFLFFGVLFDEYYKFFQSSLLNLLADKTKFFGGTRHSLFFAIPLLLIGEYIATKRDILNKKKSSFYLVTIIILFILGFIEAMILRSKLGGYITLDLSLFGWTPAIPLFIFGLNTPSKLTETQSRSIRKLTDLVYILHAWIIDFTTSILEIKYVGCYIVVIILSFLISFVILKSIEKIKFAIDKS